MNQRCCKECKYADWDADGCTCLIDKRLVYNAFSHSCDQFRREKPITNADRIRQMTDEEFAEWFAPYMHCNRCDKTLSSTKKNKAYGCNMNECKKYALIYMKQEAIEDAAD